MSEADKSRNETEAPTRNQLWQEWLNEYGDEGYKVKYQKKVPESESGIESSWVPIRADTEEEAREIFEDRSSESAEIVSISAVES